MQSSASQLPIETSSIDVIVSFETIEHLTEQEEMMFEIKRVLKPNGIVIISSPDKKIMPTPEISILSQKVCKVSFLEISDFKSLLSDKITK